MGLALAEAHEALMRGDVPIGAVLVKEGSVLAVGSNRKTDDPTAHAEIEAIRKGAARLGRWNLTGCTLYATLEPCAMCAGALVLARVSTLVFGGRDPRAGACGTLYNIVEDGRLNHRCTVRRGVLGEECTGLLVDYFRKRRDARRLEQSAVLRI
ncbi:MAG TPA: tRNA-specific adenosine deaminase [Synergistaceae bacterium]|nr:tRNA-specific adenosine deaminase [Synergistaceae bacterium]